MTEAAAVEAPEIAERYLRLGLRLDRHEEGTVDAYFGPPELAEQIKAEPLTEPAVLVAEAEALLDELNDGWLRDQVTGLRTFAGVLAGESRAYSDEVEGCYGIRPPFTDEAVLAAAHEELDALLPGRGTLDERHMAWYNSMLMPVDRIERTISAVIEEAQRQTRRLVDLPEGETTELEIVEDVPWMGFNFYRGALRGRVAINTSVSMSAFGLLGLAMHETYPGHQAERACKEQALVRGRGLLEESIVMVPAPQSVVSEGIGCLAPHVLLDGGEDPEAFTAILRDVAGIEIDLAHCLAVERAAEPTRWSDVNAALMFYERGASEEEVQAYLVRWGVMDEGKAQHLIRFFKEPTSRTYIVNYPAGFALCSAYAQRRPENLRRLLTEQIRVSDLQAA